jgi:hypothetical protein
MRNPGLEPPSDLAPVSANSTIIERFLPLSMNISFRHVGEEDQLNKRGFIVGFQKRKKVQKSAAHILWSGCTAGESDLSRCRHRGQYHGEFTCFLHKHLRRDKAAPRGVLLRKARSSLERNRFPQPEAGAESRSRPVLKRG